MRHSRPDPRTSDLGATAERPGEDRSARAAALRSILISVVGLLAVMAMILTLTGSDRGLAP